MTLTHPDAPTRPLLQFRRAVYVYDRDARSVDWSIDGDTLIQIYPAASPPGYLQNCTRALVPAEVQESVLRDFPALRRLAEVAEATQPGAPIEHPSFQRMRRHIVALYSIVVVKTIVLIWLISALLSRR